MDSANELHLVFSPAGLSASLPRLIQAVASTAVSGRKESMNQGGYDEQNHVKASFDEAYTARTPH